VLFPGGSWEKGPQAITVYILGTTRSSEESSHRLGSGRWGGKPAVSYSGPRMGILAGVSDSGRPENINVPYVPQHPNWSRSRCSRNRRHRTDRAFRRRPEHVRFPKPRAGAAARRPCSEIDIDREDARAGRAELRPRSIGELPGSGRRQPIIIPARERSTMCCSAANFLPA